MNYVDAHIDAEEQPPQPLCTNCFHPTAKNDDFCSNCSAPVGLTVTIDPFKRIFAMGFIYRKIAFDPINGFKLIAAWLIFLPMIFTSCFFIIDEIDSLMKAEIDSIAAMFILSLLYFLPSVFILYKITRNYLNTRSKNIKVNTEDN